MKINFARKALLMVAVALGLSAATPAHAMDMESMRSGAASMVMRAQEIASLGKNYAMDNLNKAGNSVIKNVRSLVKCAKSEQGCTGRQKAVLTAAVATLAVAATAVTLLIGKKMEARRIAQQQARITAEMKQQPFTGTVSAQARKPEEIVDLSDIQIKMDNPATAAQVNNPTTARKVRQIVPLSEKEVSDIQNRLKELKQILEESFKARQELFNKEEENDQDMEDLDRMNEEYEKNLREYRELRVLLKERYINPLY